MPSNAAISALSAALLGFLLAPQLGTVAVAQSTIFNSPRKFVRDKVLDYDVIKGLQKPTGGVPLDALIITRDGHKFSAGRAKKDDELELLGSERTVTAKVLRASDTRLVYREDFPYGQKLVHTLKFEGEGEKRTRFEYERKWKGSIAMLLLGQVGLVDAVDGFAGNLEELRVFVEGAYEDETELFGNARYD